MRHLIIFFVLLLMATPAIAGNTTGEITLGGQFVSGNNTDNSAQFLKYRDIDDQVLSGVKISTGQDGFFLTGSAENIGYDDQEYALAGNFFGKGKFSLWYDELTHNYSLDDKTLHTGTGSGNLVFAGVDESDASTWLSHDFNVDRSQIGASFEITMDSPFFVLGEITRTEKEETYPIAVQDDGRTPMEVPAPVDYTTDIFTVKAGYNTQKFFAQVDVMFSDFSNDEDLLEWEPTPTGDDPPGTTYTLAPDNDSIQIGGQFILRELPVSSILAMRGSYAENESDPTLPELAGGVSWDGEQTYTNFDAKLKSRPSDQLTTKIAYHYTEKDNDGDSLDYADMFGPNASEEIARYLRPYDAADKDEDTIRWQFDMIPCDTVDLGLNLAYSDSDYDETVIGRTEDDEHSIVLDASIALPMSGQLYVYAGYEERALESANVRYRNNAEGSIDGGVPIPSADENSERYNWDIEREDIGTSFGVKCDMPLMQERLKLSAAYDYMDNDGEAGSVQLTRQPTALRLKTSRPMTTTPSRPSS